MSPSSSVALLRPAVAKAAPILKWAGGKRRLIPVIKPLLPERMGRYFEPFMGGAALFFHLQPVNAVLSDVNEELSLLYGVVRDELEALIEDLQQHRYEKAYYYRMRALDVADLTPVQRASRTLYLNRTCFNGLYRVNRRGQFNVPFGRYSNPVICQEERLRAAHILFNRATVRNMGYAEAVADAKSGDFIYFDPPYQPISRTANFTAYTAGAFGETEQAELATLFGELGRRGVKCLLSNSDTPLIRELYDGFEIEAIEAPRAISRNAKTRLPAAEVLVRNYTS